MRGRPPIGDAGALRAVMEKAQARRARGELLLTKAIFYGPKGGKWADSAHTIPYKELKGRRKGAKDEPKGRRQSGVHEIPKGRKKGQDEPAKGRTKAAPDTVGKEKSKPEDNGKRRPGSAVAPKGRDKAQDDGKGKPKGTEDAPKPAATREWVKGADYGLQETDKQHKGEDGEYTPVRKKLHEEIYAKFLDHVPTVPENQKPTAIVTMGGPAAGKTTLVKHVQSNFNDFAVVNPDDVKEELPEYQKGINLGEKDGKTVSARDAAFLVHNESSDVAIEIQKLAIEQRKNIILDGTGKNVEKYRKKIADLKAAGYHVQVIMPHVDMNEAIDRVETRAEKTGRYVPEDIVRHAHTRIPSNFEAIARTADEFALFKSGRPPKAVWAGGAGKGDVVHDANYVRDFLRLGKRLTQEVESGMHKSENGGGDKPPSVSLDDLVKRVASFDAPEEDKDAEQIQGGNGDGVFWPIEDYEDEIREHMDKQGGVKKSVAFTVPTKRFIVKGGPYIGPRGGKWADPQHKIPYESAKRHHARVTGRGKRTLGPGEEVGFPWKRYAARAKGMNNDQLEGAIQDALSTLVHADAMDRETGGDRGGHYRDEIGVYRKELKSREAIGKKMGAAQSKSKAARAKGRAKARQAMADEHYGSDEINETLKERSKKQPQDADVSAAIGGDRWHGLKLLGYKGADFRSMGDDAADQASLFHRNLVEYGVITPKEAAKLEAKGMSMMSLEVHEGETAVKQRGADAFSKYKESKEPALQAMDFAESKLRRAGVSKAKAKAAVRKLRNEAYEKSPDYSWKLKQVRDVLGDYGFDTTKYVAIDATYRESMKYRSRKPQTNGPVKDSNLAKQLYNKGIKLVRKSELADSLRKGGPYIGPRGGKWADAAHTIAWKERKSVPVPAKDKDDWYDAQMDGPSPAQIEKQMASMLVEYGSYQAASQAIKDGKTLAMPFEFEREAHKRAAAEKPKGVGEEIAMPHTLSPMKFGKKPELPEGAMSTDGYDAADVVNGDAPYKPGDALHPDHKSPETAYVIEDYPYGRSRTQMRVWIDRDKKGRGRLMRQTLDPKTTGHWNKPKGSTYSDVMVAVFNEDGHIANGGASFSWRGENTLRPYAEKYGGHMSDEQKLDAALMVAYDELGAKGIPRDEAKEIAFKHWAKQRKATGVSDAQQAKAKADKAAKKKKTAAKAGPPTGDPIPISERLRGKGLRSTSELAKMSVDDIDKHFGEMDYFHSKGVSDAYKMLAKQAAEVNRNKLATQYKHLASVANHSGPYSGDRGKKAIARFLSHAKKHGSDAESLDKSFVIRREQ